MRNLYKDVLYDFQKQIVDKSREINKYGLYLDMGLGKTLTSLSIAQEKNKKKILILCPTSKLEEWSEDIEKELGLPSYKLDGTSNKDQDVLDNFTEGAIIVNYERAWRRNILEILDNDFIIIADESHYLKHRTSKVGKWAVEASKKVSDVLLLTGTPISNGDVRQWYNQIVLLGSDIKYSDFQNKYAITELVKMNGNRWLNYIGPKNEKELHEAIGTRASFLKTEDAIELPKQNIIDIPLIHDKKTIYNKVKKHKIYKDELIIETAGALFLRLRQLSSNFIEEFDNVGKHKKTALKELLESNENNMLVFYNFNKELEQIKQVCKDIGVKVYEINGSTKNISEIKDGERYIIAGQYASASSGWNGQFINNTIYYSPPLSSSDYEQSLKRTNRIGQNNICFYYRFITKGSIEENIYETLARGENYTEQLFREGK